MSLNKHQIFANDDLSEQFVDMPEWGGKVKIKAFSAREQLEMIDFIEKEPSEIQVAIKFIILSCVDEHNNKLFTEDDIDNLMKKKAMHLAELANKIATLNKQDGDAVEDLAKN